MVEHNKEDIYYQGLVQQKEHTCTNVQYNLKEEKKNTSYMYRKLELQIRIQYYKNVLYQKRNCHVIKRKNIFVSSLFHAFCPQ